MFGRAFLQGNNKFDALEILLVVKGIFCQTFGVAFLNFGTRCALEGFHRLVVACGDLDKHACTQKGRKKNIRKVEKPTSLLILPSSNNWKTIPLTVFDSVGLVAVLFAVA